MGTVRELVKRKDNIGQKTIWVDKSTFNDNIKIRI